MKVAKVCGFLHYDKFSGTDYMVPVYENRKFHVIRGEYEFWHIPFLFTLLCVFNA